MEFVTTKWYNKALHWTGLSPPVNLLLGQLYRRKITFENWHL